MPRRLEEGRVKVEVYERELALHREEVRKWRNLESSLQHKSKHDLNFVVISYDDTSALQLPRFTNRDLKNFPTSTIDFIPWNVMNYGSGENAYFYTFKNDVKKGGNRICTFLYTLLKRIKFSTVPGHCQKLARELVLMGDNYSENKCNTLFAFCSFLIHLGWFDKIEMLFGPVGHTHNGNDSVHHCHNNIAGDFDSITLPEFLQKFDFAWSKETMRPQPVFFDSCYNWDEFFDPHMNRVGGFSATSQSDLYVRALKFEIGPSGKVEMLSKGSPSNAQWAGVDQREEKYPDAAGVVILDTCPDSTPNVLPHLGLSKYPHLKIKHFESARMREREHSVRLDGSLNWMISVLKDGKLPTHGPVVENVSDSASGYGTVEKVGVDSRVVNLPIVRCSPGLEHAVMFKLPLESEQDRLTRLEQLASVMTPDTVARPLFYVSKSKKRMMTLIGKTQSFRSSLSSLGSRDAEDAESSSSESSGGDEPKRNRRKRREREEKKDQLGPEDEWSADFSGCQVGAFAVIHAKYDTGCGMSIVKVTTVEKQN